MKKEMFVLKEKERVCRTLVDWFTDVCKIESRIKNNCETCPFKLFKDSINVEVLEETNSRITMNTIYPNINGTFLGVK